MSDEARAREVAELLALMALRNPGSIEDFRRVFDVGVAEGIRLAREAVANVDPIDSALMGSDAGLAAIDALGEEQDR